MSLKTKKAKNEKRTIVQLIVSEEEKLQKNKYLSIFGLPAVELYFI